MSLNDFKQTSALGPNALFALPQGASQTYAPTNTPPKQVIVEPLALTRLPAAMRNMGWHTAAALMQRWFDSPAWGMPDEWKDDRTRPDPLSLSSAECDQDIVKMDWAMKFERCRKAVKLAESRATNPNAIEQLKKRLRESGWKQDSSFDLGFYNMPAQRMDALCQINIAPLGNAWDPLDDMYGALGSATVKVGITGTAFRQKNLFSSKAHYYFRVDYLGFYIRDHYDFNGTQYLGTWTENGVLTKAETALTPTMPGQLILRIKKGPFAVVSNGDFQKYRSRNGKGGDFLIYSDVMWKKSGQVIELGERL